VDRILRRELDAIARNNHCGAAELVEGAANAILQWTRRRSPIAESDWLGAAKHLLRCKPSMAPFLRLSNEILLAVDRHSSAVAVAERVLAFKRKVITGPKKIALFFRRFLRGEKKPFIQTYSYSSTVLACLVASKDLVDRVWCSESRPAYEGREMASKLARAGISVDFSTDACMFGQIWRGHIILLGADAVLSGWIAGKAGIKTIMQCAIANGCRVFLAADSTKFWPETSRSQYPQWDWTFGADDEVWKKPPRNVDVYNLYFELVQYRKDSRFRFLTEYGVMTSAQVRGEIAKIKLSPRLEELLD